MGVGNTTVVSLGTKPKGGQSVRFKWRYALIVGFLLWGSYEYMFVQRPLQAQERAVNTSLVMQLQEAKQQAGQLSNQIVNLHSTAYIAQLAQQKYNLIMPGEVLFASSNSGSSSSPP